MRRPLLTSLAIALVVAAGCGDDGGDDTARTGNDDAAEELRADPSKDNCLTAFETFLGALEVPEGVDTSDGLDDNEREAVNGVYAAASEESGMSLGDEAHPCDDATADADMEIEAMFRELPQEIKDLISAEAQKTFTSTGEAIN
jgi:hypothetical protein